MKRIKQIFHMLPASIQNLIIIVFEEGRNIYNYFYQHLPIERKVRKILIKNDLQGIRKTARWRIKPIFSQYYVAKYDEKKVFCKVYKKPDYGCIQREERALQLIEKEGSPWLRAHTPTFVKSIYQGDIEIIVTEYIESHELSKKNKDINNIFSEMLKILQGLNEVKINHVDIRPSNFRLTKDEKLILIDYGLAFIEKYKADDELYKTMEFPEDLWGTGCDVYNIKNGMFDDAFAVLKTLKQLEPRFIRKFHEEWLLLNEMIGKSIITVSKKM